MNGTKALELLKGLCRDLDEGRRPRRLSWTNQVIGSLTTAGFAVGLAAAGLGGCGAHSRLLDEEICDNGEDDDGDGLTDCDDYDCLGGELCPARTAYGVPWPEDDEICDDGVDNDSDGLTDCADPDCTELCDFPEPDYAAPFEEICDDGEDNDGDGLIDYDDPDCLVIETPLYGIPPFEDVCDDGEDNDGDGDVDCDDDDCALWEGCLVQLAYGVPWPEPELLEVCNDGVDNDGDGFRDCEDPDCETFPCCVPTDLMYGAPFDREDCENGLDDDCDGLIDCEDSFCVEHEACEPGES